MQLGFKTFVRTASDSRDSIVSIDRWNGREMAEGSANQTFEHSLAGFQGLSLRADGFNSEEEESDLDVEEEEEQDEESLVTLGFVQPVEQPWKVARHHFPSKVGGTPAWLDPVNIPEGEDTSCGMCGTPLRFVMQVYAPLGVEDPAHKEEVFHRSLFLFVCPDMACLQQDQHHQHIHYPAKPCRSVKVFRSQLPRVSRFYSYEPPSVEGDDCPSCDGVPLCTWCGTWKATSVCRGCKQVGYCCHTHQLAHWRAGHDSFCNVPSVNSSDAISSSSPTSDLDRRKLSSTDDHNPITDLPTNAVQTMVQDVLSRVAATPHSPGVTHAISDKLWPEMELIVGEESSSVAQNLSNKAQHLLTDYENRRQDGDEFSATDMQDVEESSREQRHWVAFQAQLTSAPDQVLRYWRASGAKALWPSLEGQPKVSDIPPCSNCGGPRIFEFQLLPQLLYFLGVQNEADTDSLDWATIAVYSCAGSCGKRGSESEAYVEEFPWVQLAVT